jgi:hypothetical protein
MFKHKIFCQYCKDIPVHTYSTINHRDIPVRNIQLVRTFQHKIVNQYEHSSTQYYINRDIPVQHIQNSKDTPVQSIQSAGMFSPKYSVGKDIPVQNIQSIGTFQNIQAVEIYSVQNIQSIGTFQSKIFRQQKKYSVPGHGLSRVLRRGPALRGGRSLPRLLALEAVRRLEGKNLLVHRPHLLVNIVP